MTPGTARRLPAAKDRFGGGIIAIVPVPVVIVVIVVFVAVVCVVVTPVCIDTYVFACLYVGV